MAHGRAPQQGPPGWRDDTLMPGVWWVVKVPGVGGGSSVACTREGFLLLLEGVWDICDLVFCKLHGNGFLPSPLSLSRFPSSFPKIIPLLLLFGISNILAIKSPMFSALFGQHNR